MLKSVILREKDTLHVMEKKTDGSVLRQSDNWGWWHDITQSADYDSYVMTSKAQEQWDRGI